MELISKLLYQAKKNKFDIERNIDDVKISNIINKKYVKILPNGKIFSDDTLGHDHALKCLMPDFLIKDPFSGSFLCLPCEVRLIVGKGASDEDIMLAKDCLFQSFENVKDFKVVEDDKLLSSECRIDHKFDLSFKERHAFIKACLEYLL